MQENDEKRIERTVVWLDAKLVPRMDGWLAADNCKNRSEFINKALRFYMGYLGTEDNTTYISRAILTAIQGTLDDNNNRLCRILFKCAVELNMLCTPSPPTSAPTRSTRGSCEPTPWTR